MKYCSFLRTAAWLVAIVAAYVIGRTQTENISVEQNPFAQTSPKPQRNSSREVEERAGKLSRLERNPFISDTEDKANTVRQIVRIADYAERMSAMLDFISILDAEDFEIAATALTDLGINSAASSQELETLFVAWAKLNPEAAIRFASEETDRPYNQYAILAVWAKNNLEAAIDWSNQNADSSRKPFSWMRGVIKGIAASDPSAAIQLVSNLESSGERGIAIGEILDAVSLNGKTAIEDWFKSISDVETKQRAVSQAASQFSEREPELAARWVKELNDISVLNRTSSKIVKNWYQLEPEAAVKWVMELPDAAIDEGAEGVVNAMMESDHHAAANFITGMVNSHRDINFDRSMTNFVWAVSKKDPEFAAVWVSGISNNSAQDRAYRKVFKEWVQQDKPAAEYWMQENREILPSEIIETYNLSAE